MTYRRFEDIPVNQTCADKFGRIFTKKAAGVASNHGDYVDGRWVDKFDTSREYYEATEDELEDCDTFDAWPYFAV